MKISIIGIGRVGSSLAYTLVMHGFCRELVLVNRSQEVAEGDAHDLRHAQAFAAKPVSITAGDVPETANSDIIAYCASVPMEPGFSSRLTLGPSNARLIAEQLPPLLEASPEAKLVMISNPVDVLSYLAIRRHGFPAERVLGTGTLIDSMRFREELSREIGIHVDDLRAYILGEHGDTQFPVMSHAQVAGEHLADSRHRRETFEQARHSGFQIFSKKGYTNHAIAAAAAYIIRSIVEDDRRTMPISTLIDGYLGESEVCLSLPVVIGSAGIVRVLHPELDREEADAFRNSAAAVRDAIDRAEAPVLD